MRQPRIGDLDLNALEAKNREAMRRISEEEARGELMKDLTLSDMTKDELVTLINDRMISYNQRDLRRIRWQSMVDEAQRVCNEACEAMKEHSGVDPVNIAKWYEDSKQFDRGMKLHDAAEAFFTAMDEDTLRADINKMKEAN